MWGWWAGAWRVGVCATGRSPARPCTRPDHRPTRRPEDDATSVGRSVRSRAPGPSPAPPHPDDSAPGADGHSLVRGTECPGPRSRAAPTSGSARRTVGDTTQATRSHRDDGDPGRSQLRLVGRTRVDVLDSSRPPRRQFSPEMDPGQNARTRPPRRGFRRHTTDGQPQEEKLGTGARMDPGSGHTGVRRTGPTGVPTAAERTGTGSLTSSHKGRRRTGLSWSRAGEVGPQRSRRRQKEHGSVLETRPSCPWCPGPGVTTDDGGTPDRREGRVGTFETQVKVGTHSRTGSVRPNTYPRGSGGTGNRHRPLPQPPSSGTPGRGPTGPRSTHRSHRERCQAPDPAPHLIAPGSTGRPPPVRTTHHVRPENEKRQEKRSRRRSRGGT